jgi:hypothetical protein
LLERFWSVPKFKKFSGFAGGYHGVEAGLGRLYHRIATRIPEEIVAIVAPEATHRTIAS